MDRLTAMQTFVHVVETGSFAAARGAGTGLSGNLRVGAATTFARLHIIPHLGPFLAQYPGVKIEGVLNDHSLNLVEEGIDVALRMGNVSASE